MAKRVTKVGKGFRRGLPQPQLEVWARERIERCQTLYEKEDNPLFAWNAYDLARMSSLPLPEWVLEYFDFVTMNLQRISGAQPAVRAGQIASRLQAALGFVPGGVEMQFIRDNWQDAPEALREKPGRFNPLDLDRARAPLEYSEAVAIYERMGKVRPEAVRNVAAAHRVSTRTVYRALAKYPQPSRDKK